MMLICLNKNINNNLNLIANLISFKLNLHKIFNNSRRHIYIKPKTKQKVDFGKYVLWTIPLATFCLGVWQVERRKWKIELIETINKRKNQAPQPLPHIESQEQLEDLEYVKFLLSGKFDHNHEIVLLPRSNVDYVDHPTTNIDNLSGGYVITPFLLHDGRRVLVNRGWVKRAQIDPSTRQDGQIDGMVTICGVLRLSEKNRGQIRSHRISTHWHKRINEEMAYELDTLPILLDADRDSTVSGGPIGGQTRLVLRNEHWQYIFTWFSLSACTTFLFIKKYFIK